MIDTVDEIKDLYYRGRFLEVTSLLRDSSSTEYLSYRISALFEMQSISEAVEELSYLRDGPETYYVHGKLKYFTGHYAQALDYFSAAVELRNSFYLRALLGCYYTSYSLGRYQLLPDYIERMVKCEPLEAVDEKISLALCRSHYEQYRDTDVSKKFAEQALYLSGAKSWSYFVARCLYRLAQIAQLSQKNSESKVYLELLKSLVDEDKDCFLSHIINLNFSELHPIRLPIEFDPLRLRVFIGQRWEWLNNEHEVYFFLEYLSKNNRFVSIEELEKNLAIVKNKKRSINYISKKAIKIVEKNPEQPIFLTSRNREFRLSSC